MRLLSVTLAVLLSLALAAPAFAADNGEGIVGETNDKVITFFGLGLVVFFTLVTIVGSTIQALLERRKEARKATELRRRVGW
jgi:nitrogen fixation/metabolism regulation signal transduction histidine kinase